MQWLQGSYAKGFNRYRKAKCIFWMMSALASVQGRFKSLIVETGRYFLDLVDYIHLNPLRANLVDADSLWKYRCSSLNYFPSRANRPEFLNPVWMSYGDVLNDTRKSLTCTFNLSSI